MVQISSIDKQRWKQDGWKWNTELHVQHQHWMIQSNVQHRMYQTAHIDYWSTAINSASYVPNCTYWLLVYSNQFSIVCTKLHILTTGLQQSIQHCVYQTAHTDYWSTAINSALCVPNCTYWLLVYSNQFSIVCTKLHILTTDLQQSIQHCVYQTAHTDNWFMAINSCPNSRTLWQMLNTLLEPTEASTGPHPADDFVNYFTGKGRNMRIYCWCSTTVDPTKISLTT